MNPTGLCQFDIDSTWQHHRCLLPKHKFHAQHLRGLPVEMGHLRSCKLVTQSTVFYTLWKAKFPCIIVTKACNVGWEEFDRKMWCKDVLPIHWNVGCRKIGVPVRRNPSSGDFYRDPKSKTYIFGRSKDGTDTVWTQKPAAQHPVHECNRLAAFLDNFTKRLIPDLWADMRAYRKGKGFLRHPHTQSRTGMVSFNYQSVFHVDERDEHISTLVVCKPQHMKGGWLVFIEWGIIIPLNDGDILHFWGMKDIHGTFEILFSDDDVENHIIRTAMVLYT